MSIIQLKKRILVQNQGGREVHLGGILAYFEELNRTPNIKLGQKTFLSSILVEYLSIDQ